MKTAREGKEAVLVGVLKNQRDQDLLFRERWYRIPLASMPKRTFRYVAFYQPAVFRLEGKRIVYYARVLSMRTRLRRTLFPKERKHPRADEPYAHIRVGRIQTLPRPIRNSTPRRVVFGFTTLRRLRTARNMLQLYGVAPTEQIMQRALRRLGIPAVFQQSVSGLKARYRLDFAIFCKRGSIAIECDNVKAHAGRYQREKDVAKDMFLRRHGWTVIRLTEQDMLEHLDACLARVTRAVKDLGGPRG